MSSTRHRHSKRRTTSTEEIALNSLPRSISSNRSTIITVASSEQERKMDDEISTENKAESELVKIIERKQRKDW